MTLISSWDHLFIEMDFGSLLHAAQANEHKVKKEPVKCYRTTFAPPKKEQKNKFLSENIQKFVARKEAEEKQKELEAKRKRDELLALRSQDGKAKKRVAAMLTRTKAANKSAIEDAIDDDNTAVTLGGPSQPDEDDYGYVSQEASAYYTKFFNKYTCGTPDEPLFPQKIRKSIPKDLSSTKDRVRMALLKEEEDEQMPHKRKRKQKVKDEDDLGDATLNYSSSDIRDFSSSEVEKEEVEKASEVSKPMKINKPRKFAPPMDFQELLKLAEKKQFEPVKVEPRKKHEDDEPERPMTKKQKQEYMQEQDWRRRREEAAKMGSTSSQRMPRVNIDKEMSVEDRRKEIKPNVVSSQVKVSKFSEEKNNNKFLQYNRSKLDGNMTARTDSNRRINQPAQKRDKMNDVNNDCLKMNTQNTNRDQNGDKRKTLQNHSNSGISKMNIPSRADMEMRNDAANVKKSHITGYGKKLQEAVTAKLQECRQESDLRRKHSSKDTTSKSQVRVLPSKTSPSSTVEKEQQNVHFQRSTNMKCNLKGDANVNKVKAGDQKVRHQDGKPLQGQSQGLRHGSSPSKSNVPLPKHVPLGVRQTTKPSSDSKERQVMSTNMRTKQLPPEQIKQHGIQTKQFLPSDIRFKQCVPPDCQTKHNPLPDSQPKHVLIPESRAKLPSGAPARLKQLPPPNIRSTQLAPNYLKTKSFPPSDMRSKQLPPSDTRQKQLPPSDTRQKQLPPSDTRQKQLPPPDARPKQFGSSGVKKKLQLPVKRRITDSDEHDSEMDDFIDDGAEEGVDYSQCIKEIFGYDRSRYTGDDDECEVSNFHQLQKEEFISAKTGLLEDLEDMRKEKMQKKKRKLK